MDRTPLLDCLVLDAFSVEQDGLAAAEIEVVPICQPSRDLCG